jgi:hypothetical protein
LFLFTIAKTAVLTSFIIHKGNKKSHPTEIQRVALKVKSTYAENASVLITLPPGNG